MNYKKIYDDIILRGKDRTTTRKEATKILGYCEYHHILPKCMGGTNEKDNMVYLSAREHFIAHLLLVKIYPEEKKLLFALCRLIYCQNNKEKRLNGKSYEQERKKLSDYRRTQNKENNSSIAKMAETKRGRNKFNDAGHAKQALTRTGWTKENHEPTRRGAEKRKGRTKETHESHAKQSAKLTGRTKETHEGYASQSRKRKGRTKETCNGCANTSMKLKGRTKETHEGYNRISKARTKIETEIKYQIYERKTSGQSNVAIHKWLSIDLGFDIHYSAISRIYSEIKRKKEAENYSPASII